jgi:hypothetical protein
VKRRGDRKESGVNSGRKKKEYLDEEEEEWRTSPVSQEGEPRVGVLVSSFLHFSSDSHHNTGHRGALRVLCAVKVMSPAPTTGRVLTDPAR